MSLLLPQLQYTHIFNNFILQIVCFSSHILRQKGNVSQLFRRETTGLKVQIMAFFCKFWRLNLMIGII